MTIAADSNLKAAFSGEQTRQETHAAEVPQSIRNHAPVPALKPGGSWKARAQEIDQRIREHHEARKASNEWASRLQNREGIRTAQAFSKSARR